jgi:hypothetical protein
LAHGLFIYRDKQFGSLRDSDEAEIRALRFAK